MIALSVPVCVRFCASPSSGKSGIDYLLYEDILKHRPNIVTPIVSAIAASVRTAVAYICVKQ